MGYPTTTQEALVQLVQATQVVATRASLVRAGAPSHLGQLLPSVLQLWSQDRPEGGGGKARTQQGGKLIATRSLQISEPTTEVAAGSCVSGSTDVAFGRSSPLLRCQNHEDGQEASARSACRGTADVNNRDASMSSQNDETETDLSSDLVRPQGRAGSRPGPLQDSPFHTTRGSSGMLRSDSFSSMPDHQEADVEVTEIGHANPVPAASTLEYLTIEDDEGDEAGSRAAEQQKSNFPPLSTAGQQLLLLLRVLRNLCATGTEATRAMAEVGVPQQVAQLVLDPPQGSVEGRGKLSKVAAQLLANMSANEGPGLDAVWAACYPATFTKLSTFHRDVHGPLCRALLHCCSASDQYAAALCSPAGSVILRNLLQAYGTFKEASPSTSDTQEGEPVMELGWLMGHLVYVRGLLPELFGALAEVHAVDDDSVGTTLDPLQCALLDVLSEEMENGTTRQQMKVSGEVAPHKPERSLLFLLTTIREIGFAIARMQGEALLEASVLEAALQVLKDMFALDDGGARLAAGQNLGSVLCRHGLVALLLSFLVALGPTSRPARAAAISGGPSQSFGMLVSPSIASTAASFPRRPPYPSFRTDVVAVLAHAAYQRREVQNELLRLGGVPVILGQCQVDSISPLVREWALWGVRNMCEGNDAVQQAVLDLQPVSPVQSPELSQMGLQVQLDTSSGKFHLVSTEAKAGVCPG